MSSLDREVKLYLNTGLTWQPPSDQVAGEVLRTIEQELWGCKDVAKLMAGVSVLSHFATLKGSSRNEAVVQLLNSLFHRYPKVKAFI
jgi:hypothetical protein